MDFSTAVVNNGKSFNIFELVDTFLNAKGIKEYGEKVRKYYLSGYSVMTLWNCGGDMNV